MTKRKRPSSFRLVEGKPLTRVPAMPARYGLELGAPVPAPPSRECPTCKQTTRWHPAGNAVCVGCEPRFQKACSS